MTATARPAILDHPRVAAAWAKVGDALLAYENAVAAAMAEGPALVDTTILGADLEPGATHDDDLDYLHLAVRRCSVGNPAALKGQRLTIRGR